MFKAIPVISKKFLIVSIAVLFLVSMILFISPGKIYGATGATLTVGPGGTYATIQAAITAASDGDTINVEAGTYTEELTINKPLTLQGAGKGVSIIDGSGVDASHLISIRGITDGIVKFDGFTVQNAPPTGDGDEGYPIVISECDDPGEITVTNNAIIASRPDYDWGVNAGNSTASVVIKHNTFDNYWMNAVLIECATGPVEIGYNTFKMADDGGPSIFSMSYSNDVVGLHWYHHNNLSAKNDGESIYQGIVVASAWGDSYGVRSHGAYSNLVIEENVISDLQSFSRGIQLEVDGPNGGFTNPQIKNNTITGPNTGDNNFGIRLLGDVTGPIITGNTLTDLYYGIHLRGTFSEEIYPTGVQINNNNIDGNTSYGVKNEGTEVADATNNWWGDASGPHHETLNPDGTGDAVSDNVNFDPWLHNPVGYVAPKPSVPKPLTPEEQASLDLSIEQQVAVYGASNVGFTKTLYDNILGRAADSEGLNDWVTALNEGSITLGDVIFGFVFSKELEPLISPAGPEEFITFLYKNVLNRDPDIDGYNNWVTLMQNGMTKEEVLLHFIDSGEFQSICEMFGLKL